MADGDEPDRVYLFDGDLANGNFEGSDTDADGVPDTDVDANGLPTPNSATVNFADTFSTTTSPGADGGSDSTDWSLVLGAGLAGTQVQFSLAGLTSGGTAVLWSEITAGEVYAGVLSGSGTQVFVLTSNGDGTVTFEQKLAFDHPDLDTAAEYTTDILVLDDGQISLQKEVTVTDGGTGYEGDTATASDTVDLGGNFAVGDDGPEVEFGNLVGTGTDTSQIGYWSASPGADGAGSLTLAAASTFTFYRADGGTETGSVSAFAFNSTSGLWEGTLTGDFDDNDATANTSVNFTLEVKSDGSYLFDIVGGLSQPIDLDTQDGELAPGGPDAVQTLLIPAPPDPLELSVVFFGVDLSGDNPPDSDDVLAALRFENGDERTEADLQELAGKYETGASGAFGDGTFAWINEIMKPNVSKSGIGAENNQLEGDDLGGVPTDESFVANPDGYVSKVRVNIDNASPYNPATETMLVVVFYESGNYAQFDVGAPGSEIAYNLGDPYFEILADETEGDIDAVQFIMDEGKTRITSLTFTTSEELSADDIRIDFTATQTDAEGDSASSSFSVDLFGRAVGEAYDVTMQDADDFDSVPDATADTFNIDLSNGDAKKYLINGFDTLIDDLVFLNATGGAAYSLGVDLDNDNNLDDSRVVIDGVTVDLIDVVLDPTEDVFIFV